MIRLTIVFNESLILNQIHDNTNCPRKSSLTPMIEQLYLECKSAIIGETKVNSVFIGNQQYHRSIIEL